VVEGAAAGAGVAGEADGAAGAIGERCGVVIGADVVDDVTLLLSAVRTVPGLK